MFLLFTAKKKYVTMYYNAVAQYITNFKITEEVYMANKNSKHKKLAVFSFISILIFVVGVILTVVYVVIYKKLAYNVGMALQWAGIGVSSFGFILTLICIVLFQIADARDRHPKEEPVEQKPKKEPEKVVEKKVEEPKPAANTTPNVLIADSPSVTYIPSREAYDVIVMGQCQTLDEKFNEIGKMDKTQFVVYVARLFSRKGYQVKLTPVVDNHDIDMLVEKMGVIIAVGCLLTTKILCKEDIVCVKEGNSFYGANNCMVLTNMYFDKSAFDYAKQEHMSLVDRNILAEDFMD